MDLLKQTINRFQASDTVYRTIGNDNANGIISCGFLRKAGNSTENNDIVFKYYGALLVLDGKGIYKDYDGRETELYPGCFVQRLPGRLHNTYIEADNKWLEVFICIGRDLYRSLADIGIINRQKPVLKPGLDYLLIQKFLLFFNSLKKAASSDLPQLLVEAQKIILKIHELDTKQKDRNTENLIDTACRIIADNIHNGISAHEVSKRLQMGYENFRKQFKAETGISPNAYIIQARIDAARSLLLDSSRTVTEISQSLGYSDPFIFSKQFKKVVGKSPMEFRKQF